MALTDCSYTADRSFLLRLAAGWAERRCAAPRRQRAESPRRPRRVSASRLGQSRGACEANGQVLATQGLEPTTVARWRRATVALSNCCARHRPTDARGRQQPVTGGAAAVAWLHPRDARARQRRGHRSRWYGCVREQLQRLDTGQPDMWGALPVRERAGVVHDRWVSFAQANFSHRRIALGQISF